MKVFLMCSAAIAAFAGTAIAAPAPKPQPPMQDIKRSDIEANLKERFDKIDTNKDGVITQAEISAHRDAQRAQRQDERFKKLDSNGDGSISRAEFDAGHARPMERPHSVIAREQIQPGDHAKAERGMKGHGFKGQGFKGRGHGRLGHHDFAAADANKDGNITWAEGSAAALAHFDKMDTNKDGVATVAEQQAFHKAMRDKWQARADAKKATPKAP